MAEINDLLFPGSLLQRRPKDKMLEWD